MPLALDTGDRCATCGGQFGTGLAAKTRGHLRSRCTRHALVPWYVWQCLDCNRRQRGYRLSHWLEILRTRTYCDARRATHVARLITQLRAMGLAAHDL